MSDVAIRSVLVVDDEPLFVRSLADGLKSAGERDGFVVRTATNGSDAILAMQSEPVDLVLTDLRMAGVDGFQLISWMISNKKAVPVVVMTAMPSIEARLQLRDSGVFTVLQKPVDLAEVHKCIVTELGARRARVEGLAVSAFLQLVSMERVSCILTIRSGAKVGHMGIVGGDLVHADFEEREGISAAHFLVGLPEAVIEMVEREDVRQTGLRVPLAEVVLDALRSHDELARGKGSITSPPAALDVDLEFDLLKSVRPPAVPDPETTPPPPAVVSALAATRVPLFDVPATNGSPESSKALSTPHGAGSRPLVRRAWPGSESEEKLEPPTPEEAPAASALASSAATRLPSVVPVTAPLAPAPSVPVTVKKEIEMNVISVEKANAAVNKLRETLGVGLVATDVWNVEDGMPIAGFNSQPVATALFNRITDLISETLSESGFPALNKYYMLDLAGDKLVVVIPLGKYRAGMLVDKKKAQLGLIVSVALPKYVNGLEEAIRG